MAKLNTQKIIKNVETEFLQDFEKNQRTKATEEKKYFKSKEIPNLQIGDNVKVGVKIIEGERERVQFYEGTIIAKKNSSINTTITVRKTLQGIAIASHYREEWPMLVICPSSVRMSWAAEIMKWLDVSAEQVGVIMSSSHSVNNLVNIISYDLAHRMIEQIEARQFKVLVIDESHYLKSRTAKRTKAIDRLVDRASRVILLSGTPALSRPEELYTQIRCLQPSLFSSFHSFASRYCAAHKVSLLCTRDATLFKYSLLID